MANNEINRMRQLAGLVAAEPIKEPKRQLSESENMRSLSNSMRMNEGGNVKAALDFLDQSIAMEMEYSEEEYGDEGYDDEGNEYDPSGEPMVVILQKAKEDIAAGNYDEKWLEALSRDMYELTTGSMGYGDPDFVDGIIFELADLLDIEIIDDESDFDTDSMWGESLSEGPFKGVGKMMMKHKMKRDIGKHTKKADKAKDAMVKYAKNADDDKPYQDTIHNNVTQRWRKEKALDRLSRSDESTANDRARYDAADSGDKKKVTLPKAPWEKDEVKEADDKEEISSCCSARIDSHDGKHGRCSKCGEMASVVTTEAAKPDFADIDGDGNKKETAKKAAKDKKEMSETEQMREWANSVYKQYDDRGHYQEQPEGETVDLSLRRYLNATPQKVTVSEDIKPKDMLREYKSFKEQDDNPYAIGMAQAKKATGDEPPLKKSTIKKAHKIAKAVKKDK